jgi:hypothetical protein
MTWQEFILAMVGTLAWPVVIVIAALVLRREYRKQIREENDR